MTLAKVFTDGSCIRDVCGYGVRIHCEGMSIIYNKHGKIKNEKQTNQVAELYAIYKGLKCLFLLKILCKKIEIYTDSMYCINSLTCWAKIWKKNNWLTSCGKPVQNLNLIKKIEKTIKKFNCPIEFFHVKAHTKYQTFEACQNNIVDAMAKKAALS